MNTNILLPLALHFICISTVVATNCKDGDFMKDPDSCSHFYKCDHGKPVRFACGPGTYFNPDINNCDWPYNVKCDVNPGQSGATSNNLGHNAGQSTNQGGQSYSGRPGSGSGSGNSGGTSNNGDQGQSYRPDQQQSAPSSGSGNEGYLWPIQTPTSGSSSSPGQNGEDRPRPTIDDLYNGNNSPYQEYIGNNRF